MTGKAPDCSTTCGGGTRTDTRIKRKKEINTVCDGEATKKETCNTEPCPGMLPTCNNKFEIPSLYFTKFALSMIETLNFAKADERTNCPRGLVVQNMEACKEAATIFGFRYGSKINSQYSPAGCYWHHEKSDDRMLLHFNEITNLDKTEVGTNRGGLCWKGIMNSFFLQHKKMIYNLSNFNCCKISIYILCRVLFFCACILKRMPMPRR